MLVGLVVFVLPSGAATVTPVSRDGGLTQVPRLFAVGTLHQFGVTRGTAPMALDARTGLTKRCRLRVVRALCIGHPRGLSQWVGATLNAPKKKTFRTIVQNIFKLTMANQQSTNPKNILKELNSVTLKSTLSTFFSVDK
jgi:hypothetical protein